MFWIVELGNFINSFQLNQIKRKQINQWIFYQLLTLIDGLFHTPLSHGVEGQIWPPFIFSTPKEKFHEFSRKNLLSTHTFDLSPFKIRFLMIFKVTITVRTGLINFLWNAVTGRITGRLSWNLECISEIHSLEIHLRRSAGKGYSYICVYIFFKRVNQWFDQKIL